MTHRPRQEVLNSQLFGDDVEWTPVVAKATSGGAAHHSEPEWAEATQPCGQLLGEAVGEVLLIHRPDAPERQHREGQTAVMAGRLDSQPHPGSTESETREREAGETPDPWREASVLAGAAPHLRVDLGDEPVALARHGLDEARAIRGRRRAFRAGD